MSLEPRPAHPDSACRDPGGPRLRLLAPSREQRLQEMMAEVLPAYRARLPAALPASALRRPAAACRAGHGLRLPPGRHRAGRADDRPRRHDPGARAAHRAQLTSTYKVAALYVTHDLAVVANLADRIAVMYAGRLVEVGSRDELFSAACHPYTRKLLEAIPDLAGKRALRGIPGRAPVPGRRPHGLLLRQPLRRRRRAVRGHLPAL